MSEFHPIPKNPKFKNLTGIRFGRLVPVGIVAKRGRDYVWMCRCDCGTEKAISGAAIRGGNNKSCGCLHDELIGKRARTHGMTGTRTHGIWKNMISRTTCPNRPDYAYYAGRGIGVCERWRTFENFLSDMGECPSGLTLDRKDNNIGYEPGNCRWLDRLGQARNRRRTAFITYRGVTLPVAAWADRIGLTFQALDWRRKAGWDVERMMTAPSAKAGL